MSERERRFKEETLTMLTGYPLVGLLHRNDRMGMMHAVESRFPFLDEEVVRFALNLPERWKRRWSWRLHDKRHPFRVDKYIVRRAAAGTVKRSLAWQAKWDFKMYGHRHLRVDPHYFDGGYAAEMLGLSQASLRELCEGGEFETAARLVSLDVFGRCFAMREAIDAITERLLCNVRVVPDKT